MTRCDCCYVAFSFHRSSIRKCLFYNELQAFYTNSQTALLRTTIIYDLDLAECMFDDLPELLTNAETRAMLRISSPTLWRLRRDGRLPFARVRKQVRFKKSDVLAYLQNCIDRPLDLNIRRKKSQTATAK